MKSETFLLQIIEKNGEAVFLPHKQSDADARKDFLLSNRPAPGQKVYIKAHYELVADRYVELFTRRAHYFAYIKTLVDKGCEQWTRALPGHTPSAKGGYLHTQYKLSYCKAHGDVPMFSLADENIGSGEGKLSIEELVKRITWMIDFAQDAHLEITKQYGEAWTIPAYRES